MAAGRRTLWRVLQLLLLAAIAYWIFQSLAPDLATLSWSDITRRRPQPVPLALSFLLLVGVYIAHALLWRVIMRDLRIADPPARVTLRVYFLAGLGRYIPGKLWQLAGLALLAKRAGMPPGSAAAAAVLGQFGFLTTGLLFLGLTLPEWRLALGGSAAQASVAPLTAGAVLLVVGGIALWTLVATPIGHGLRVRLTNVLGSRAGERVTAAFALADRVRVRAAFGWAAGYALSWIVLGAAFALFATSFVADAAAQPRVLAGAVAAAYLAGYVVVVAPAGLGVREAAMLVLLKQIVPDLSAAVVITVLSRVWFTAAELVPLALVPALPQAVTPQEGK